ncbi:MAG: hypothetical protein AABZ55_10135, partial [Bdellovibrionota bacterium]
MAKKILVCFVIWSSCAWATVTPPIRINLTSTLAIDPMKVHAVQNQTLSFKVTGGKPPYLFDLPRGEGSLDPKTGTFKTGLPGFTLVRVTDSSGATAEAIAVVYTKVKIVPPPFTEYSPGSSAKFSGIEGKEPYHFTLKSGGGSIHADTGLFTSGNHSGKVTVQVTDSLGQEDLISIQIANPLKLSQKSEKILIGSTVTLQAEGGVPPYSFSKISGPGALDSTTGSFTATSTPAKSILRVTDARGIFQEAAIESRGLLDIYPQSKKVIAGEKIKFEAMAGTPPFQFFVTEGEGSIDPVTGAFVSGKTEGRTLIKVVDSLGTYAQAEVVVTGKLLPSADFKSIVAGFSHTCAIVKNKVRCWGDNRKGQLGSKDREKSANPMDVIGLPAPALALAGGSHHTCA